MLRDCTACAAVARACGTVLLIALHRGSKRHGVPHAMGDLGMLYVLNWVLRCTGSGGATVSHCRGNTAHRIAQANVKAQHPRPLERPFVPPSRARARNGVPTRCTALSATPSACAGLPLLCTIDAQVALLCRDILRTSANGSVTGQSKYAQDGCCEFFSRLGRLGFTIV